jgi:Chitin binding Peritrophin-A domain
MKKLITQIIYGFIAIVVVIGLTTGSANAQSLIKTDAGIQDTNNNLISNYSCNGSEDVDKLYPNPDAPTSFYQCTPYGLQLMSCPANLIFDVKANRCEYAEDSSDKH